MTTPLSRVGRHAGNRLADTGLALATVPATTLVVALRRRARRKAGNQAWRYRTHHEASADSQRIVSFHYQEELTARAESARGSVQPENRFVVPAPGSDEQALGL